jgi:hypothetical protein
VSGATPSAQNDLAAGFHRHHATGPGGTNTAKVTVTQLVDRVVVTQATYRTSTREWRVVGTATGPPPDLVTVRLGAADTLIGSAAVARRLVGAGAGREGAIRVSP